MSAIVARTAARNFLLTATLVLGLLLQAAAAQAGMTCAPANTEHAAAASRSSEHAGHANHAMQDSTQGQSQQEMQGSPMHGKHRAMDAYQQMPCCDIEQAAACVFSGCASATPTITLVPSIQMISHSREATPQPVDWFAPYAAPTDRIFRPPIA
jgi:hypothetical protein